MVLDRWNRELRHWLGRGFTVDRHAVVLAGLFLAVGAAAVGIMDLLHTAQAAASPNLPNSVSTNDAGKATASTGAAWVIAEVVFAGGILAGVMVYRRAPKWVQAIIRDSLKAWGLIVVGVFLAIETDSVAVLGGTLGLIVVLNAADQLDVWWLFNNALSVGIAIYLSVALAMTFDIYAMLIALVGLTVYDHVFANRKQWMFTMAETMIATKLPVLFIWPTRWRVNWDELVDSENGETNEHVGWGIGTADLLLPSALAATVLTAPVGGLIAGGRLPAVLVVLGAVVAAFRLRHEMLTQGSGAGLPAITAGSVGGLVVAQVVIAV